MIPPAIAKDGKGLAVEASGGRWVITWYPPEIVPDGKPHGANGLCITRADEIVLISEDGERFGWPGGRPEGEESWEQTLRREVWEEACASVKEAQLLGFAHAVCLTGPEEGLVLVRSIWRAEVEVSPWEPRHETVDRLLVPARNVLAHLWMEDGFEPVYHRALKEAALL